MNEQTLAWWQRQEFEGARALMLSSLAFSLMTVCVKQLGGRIPVSEIVLARSIVGIALTGTTIAVAGINPMGSNRRLLLLRGIYGSIALFCFFEAITALPLASATVLQYTYPTFTAGAAWVLLAEPLRRRIGLAVALGWIGVVLVIQPQWIGHGIAGLELIPVLLGLAGALFTALAYVCVRKLSVSEHPQVIILYFPLVSIPICLPAVMQQGVMPSGMDWLWLLGVGVMTQLGQIGVTRGLSCLPAARATSLNYVQVVFAATWGWIWFRETVNVLTLAGAALVLMASCISISAKR